MKLDTHGQFVTLDGKKLGVIAIKKRGRWLYKSATTGTVYASGVTPKEFVKRFWFRDDFIESE
jgi:hypothetical protein